MAQRVPKQVKPAEQRRSEAALELVDFRPVSIARVSDDVVEQIRRLIIDRRLAEGARLPSERDLAKALLASRATVSQALRMLSVMGMIEIRRGSGAYVLRNPESMVSASVDLMLDLNPASIPQLTHLRAWLELAGTQQAVHCATDNDLHEIEVALKRLAEAGSDSALWIAADMSFHAKVVKASGNSYLTTVFDSIHGLVNSVNYKNWVERNESLPFLSRAQLGKQQALHTAIFEALRRRDPAAAAQAVCAHHRAMLSHLGVKEPISFEKLIAEF
jgi:GntR family transcriptional repressor for pyruvate dehydrogenase complex